MTRIVTERLLLREQRESDAAVFRELWTERDPRVPGHRRIGADGHPTEADIADHIRTVLGRPGPRLLTVQRLAEGDVIGYCGVQVIGDGSDPDPELAFELLRAVHGRGYATESARAVVAWARCAGFARLRADGWDWNAPSRAVLRKLGFRETETPGAESSPGRSIRTVLDL